MPDATAYLLLGVERGEEFCGVRPEEALPVIRGRGRTPLTIDEGIAVVTHAPHLLEKNKCFMLSGSRRHDRRVPAMWISERAPKLGWCWDGNPHTWLGVASAAADGSPARPSAPARAMPSRLVSSMAASYAATRLAIDSGLSRSTTSRSRSGEAPDSL